MFGLKAKSKYNLTKQGAQKMSIDPGKWLSLHKGYQAALTDAKQAMDAKTASKRAENDQAAELVAKLMLAIAAISTVIALILIFK
jgi:hypothetical protein